MTEEESEKSYRSGLPGFLGVIDTAISKIEAVGAPRGHRSRTAGGAIEVQGSPTGFGNTR